MQWIELSVAVNLEDVEKAIAILGEFRKDGVTVEERSLEADGEKDYIVKIYLPHSRSFKSTMLEVKNKLAQTGLENQLAERHLKPEDWLESLKQDFKVLEVGDRLVIKPSWISLPTSSVARKVIEIDPGAAFGTGVHPTTRLCLLKLEKYLQPGMRIYDLGTGTGILAIAAAKLGASSVLAVDIDSVAVKVALKNAQINGVKELVQIRRGTLSLNAQRNYRNDFDIVLANITAQAISDLAEGLFKVVKPGGKLIVSGIHAEGLDRVLISLAMADFHLESVDEEAQWQVVVASKKAE